MTDEELDEIFEKVDMSGNGVIEFSEFLVASMNQKTATSDSHLK